MVELEIKFKDGRPTEWFSPLCSESYEEVDGEIILTIWNGHYEYEFKLGDISERNYNLCPLYP